MEVDVWQIVGIVKRKGKTGVVYTTLHLLGFHDDYTLKNAEVCEGNKVITEITAYDLPDVTIGDKVELLYAKGFEDKAVLRSLIIKEKNPVAGGNNGKK